MKSIQIFSALALLFQLAAGSEVFGGSRYRRTLYSNGGEQSAINGTSIQGAEAATPATLISTPPAATGKSTMPMAGESSVAAPADMSAETAAGLTGAAAAGSAYGSTGAGTEADSAAAAAANPAAAAKTAAIIAEVINIVLASYLNYFFIGTIIFLLQYRFARQLIRYVRTLACLNYPKQEYFYEPGVGFAALKTWFIHAPLFKHRRAQEFRPLPSIHGGVLPTRAQTVYLVLYFAVNIFLSLIFISFDQPFTVVAQQLKNRFGTIAITNLPLLIYISGRHNSFISQLQLPFDTFNTFHRWIARILILLVALHVGFFLIPIYSRGGTQAILKAIEVRPANLYGSIAFGGFLLILIQASSPIRHAAYETFKLGHKLLVAAIFVGLYFHLKNSPQIGTVKLALFLWVNDYLIRGFTLLRANAGKNGCRAHVESMPGDAVRVTLELVRPWGFLPGQHLYLYMPRIGLMTSHPFSIAWASNKTEDIYPNEKLVDNQSAIIKTVTTTKFELIIKQRGGFTKSLVEKARNAPGGKFSTFAMAEGPFGGFNALTSYGTVMLFAGGVGITHMVPYIHQLVTCHSKHISPIRRITLIWVIPHPEALNWVAQWMQEIMQIEGRRDCLHILIYVTKLDAVNNIESPSSTIKILRGRPDIGALMDWECEESNQVGAMGVSVCGGGAFADDVRAAVRARGMKSNIDFVEESFTW